MNQLLNDEAADRRSSLLREAVRRGTHAVVSHHGPGGWRTLRTKFGGYDQRRRSLVLSPLIPEAGTEPVELAPGEILGVTFRHGHKKCMFSTALQRFADHETGGSLTRAAAWLNWPDHLQKLQRRVYYRVPPPTGCTIPVSVRVRPPADQAETSTVEVSGIVEDISAGGMRIRTESPDLLSEGACVQIRFAPQHERETFDLQAVCRHTSGAADGEPTVGLQFIGLEASAKGQEMLIRLARVVTEFHRSRSRRPQAGLPGRRRSR